MIQCTVCLYAVKHILAKKDANKQILVMANIQWNYKTL